MPLKGEAKLEYNRRWRKQSIKSGYGKWLYARRKARFDDAESHQAALLKILNCRSLDRAQEIAEASLSSSVKRHKAVGPPPYSSKRDPEMHLGTENHEDNSIEAVLKRLGL